MSTLHTASSLTREQLEVVLDSVSDAVVTIDRNFRITSFNRNAERMTGTTRRRAIGRRCYEVLHSSRCQDEVTCPILQIWRGAPTSGEHEAQIRNARDEAAVVRASFTALTDEGGEIVGAAEVFHDVNGHALFGNVGTGPGAENETAGEGMSLLQVSERRTIEGVLRRHNWNRSTTCHELGLSRTTLWRKMRKLGIGEQAPDGDEGTQH